MRALLMQKNINGRTTENPFIVDDLEVHGTAEIDETLDVSGNTEIGGTLNVVGDTTLNGILNVSGNTTVSGDFRVNGDARIDQDLEVFGALSASNVSETVATRVVPPNTNYQIQPSDRLVTISTTGAGGPFTITFPTTSLKFRVTVVMTAFDTAPYTATTISGARTWSNVGDSQTFINAGAGVWYLESRIDNGV